MQAAGYTQSSGNSFIGYVYTNTDTDGDNLIDGFERIAGTCINRVDTDGDGISDGDEVLGYPRTDPNPQSVSCGSGNTDPGDGTTDPDDGSVPADAQSPLLSNWDTGFQRMSKRNSFSYVVGYSFTPKVDGQIVGVSGLFDATDRVVKIYRHSDWEVLSRSTLTSSNFNWSSKAITPVAVQADQKYVIAVFMAGGSAVSRRVSQNLPVTYGDIEIHETVYNTSNEVDGPTRPVKTMNHTVYGVIDIIFEPTDNSSTPPNTGDPAPESVQRPWQAVAHGNLSLQNHSYHVIGYKFKVLSDGNITGLGGFYNGRKKISLFKYLGYPNRFEFKKTINVTSNNTWAYGSISPFPVTAGEEYVVAVYGDGNISCRRYVSLPIMTGDIEIQSAAENYAGVNPNALPQLKSSGYICGQPDIRFEPTR